ncbi:MAG: exodeoxyribonuclease VII small subunit [Bacteroidales bacterium]|nr:exodeoxyribonuclease VII small subunit [Bacteroidales bacterium]
MAKQEIKYAQAVAEIEDILEQIETGQLDVDELTGKVKRVAFLIKLCKSKLKEADEEIKKILSQDITETED